MPTPSYMDLTWDPDEVPDARLEVMGRGPKARKSKTLLPSIELAVVLGLSGEHIRHLFELFRALHAKHYTIKVEVKQKDGSTVEKVVPHILSDDEIREIYPSVRKWESFHQEQVDHYPSVGGFSTKAALGYQEEPKRHEKKESSAGTDRQSRWE